ncbi:MAG: amidase family protein, partial [Collinsella intestinalis]
TQMYLSDLFTISINIAGNGGVTVPMGLGEDSGMPVAAQLVGKPFDDVRLLSFARAVERAATEAGAASVLPVAPAFVEKGGELA